MVSRRGLGMAGSSPEGDINRTAVPPRDPYRDMDRNVNGPNSEYPPSYRDMDTTWKRGQYRDVRRESRRTGDETYKQFDPAKDDVADEIFHGMISDLFNEDYDFFYDPEGRARLEYKWSSLARKKGLDDREFGRIFSDVLIENIFWSKPKF